jgi:predicted nucleic acid-binding protein
MPVIRAILDTNVFVAAGFRPMSASARLIAFARDGVILLVWDHPTRAETRRILEKIPRLSWAAVQGLFTDDGEFRDRTSPEDFELVRDAEDRKFAALAAATGVPLVSSDQDLLEHQGSDVFEVRTPGEMVRWVEGG